VHRVHAAAQRRTISILESHASCFGSEVTSTSFCHTNFTAPLYECSRITPSVAQLCAQTKARRFEDRRQYTPRASSYVEVLDGQACLERSPDHVPWCSHMVFARSNGR